MDSLFIARTSGVEVRLPFVSIGAEELKMASSRKWDGNFSGFGRRQTNLDGAVVCNVSDHWESYQINLGLYSKKRATIFEKNSFSI